MKLIAVLKARSGGTAPCASGFRGRSAWKRMIKYRARKHPKLKMIMDRGQGSNQSNTFME
jgi:hypothetical protein